MNEETSLLDGSTCRRKPCASMQKVCYGLGHVYNDLCAAVWFSYTLFYFQIILQMDSMTAGTLIMIGQVADSMATPAAGWAVDWIGSPRAWHLTGTGIVAVGFSLMFSVNPGTEQWWLLLYYGGLVTIFQIGWATVQISHLSVITTVAKTSKHRSDLTSIRYTASVCCNIFVYLITWTILENNGVDGIGPNDFYKFKEIVLIITGIGLVCSLVFFCGISSEEGDEIVGNGRSEENGNGRNFLRSLVTYQVSLMYMSSRLYTTLNLIYIPLYLDERILKFNQEISSIRSTVATVPLVCFVASFLTSLLLKIRPKIFTDKIIYALGVTISLIGSIWVAIGISTASNLQVYAVATLIGVGSSATLITSLCITAEFVNINGLKGGSVYSTVTFTDKLLSGLVVLLIQNLKCDGCPDFYEDVLAYATGFSSVLGLISLVTLQFHNPQMINGH